MADVENVEEMIGTRETEAASVATESGRAVATEPAGGGDRVRRGVGGDGWYETAATGRVMFTYEGELEFDEDEMAALEGQRLVAEFFLDSGSEPNFSSRG